MTKDDKVLIHSLTTKPKKNVKLTIKWEEGSDICVLNFARMMHEGENPEEPTTEFKSRLGAKFTIIGLSDKNIPALTAGLIEYMKRKGIS